MQKVLSDSTAKEAYLFSNIPASSIPLLPKTTKGLMYLRSSPGTLPRACMYPGWRHWALEGIVKATQDPSRGPHLPQPHCTLTVGAQVGGTDTPHCRVSLSPEVSTRPSVSAGPAAVPGTSTTCMTQQRKKDTAQVLFLSSSDSSPKIPFSYDQICFNLRIFIFLMLFKKLTKPHPYPKLRYSWITGV